jgi:RNA polymerase sigma factor (sigma-70 family)
MDKAIDLINAYQAAPGLEQKLALAEELFARVEPDISFFVFSNFPSPSAEDVLQESLKAIACGLGSFNGESSDQFWAWCYRIARNKLADHFRSQSSERVQPLPADELWELIDASEQRAPLSAQDRIDLDFAMAALTRSSPECFDYLWKHFVFGLAYGEIAEQEQLTPDAARMRVGRCLEHARTLVA